LKYDRHEWCWVKEPLIYTAEIRRAQRMLSNSELCGCVEVDRLRDLEGLFFGKGMVSNGNEEI
jgi:hypothetical protein